MQCIEAKRAEIIALTQDLVCIPTVNPPGDAYEDCARFLGDSAPSIARALGREPNYISSPGTCDQKHIVHIGHLKDVTAYGLGILDLAHQPDQYVGIADLVDSSKSMTLAALNLCTQG